MSEIGAEAAHRYRDRMKAKAARLGDGDDARKVDASDFDPAEKLYAGVKTGMRPVSRQARKDGGQVTGKCAGGRADRPARKAGGGLGESYVNRDSKSADEDREGHYPNGGMRKGGRAHKAEGGYIPNTGGPSATRALKGSTGSSRVETSERPAAEDGRQGRAAGGRAHRDAGGPLATPLSAGMGGQGRFNFNYGPQTSEASKLGIKYGGTVGRERAHERYGASAGPAEHHPGLARASGGRVGRAAGGTTPAPGPAESDPIMAPPLSKLKGRYARPLTRGRAEGGEVEKKVLAAHHAEHAAMGKGRARGGKANGGPTDAEKVANQREAFGFATGLPDADKRRPPAPSKPGSMRMSRVTRALLKGRAEGGKAGHGPDCDCDRCTHRRAKGGLLKEWDAKQRAEGGRAARAKGGKAGTKINIIIAPGGANPPDPNAPPGGGLPPNLGVKPPPAMPMPMPGAGGPPPPGAPTPMPIPIPMGGAGMAGAPPGGMPPRARGGRAPKAGSGSGLGRLEKIAEYGTKGPPGKSV